MPAVLVLLGVVALGLIAYATAQASQRWNDAIGHVANTFNIAFVPGSFFKSTVATGSTPRGHVWVGTKTERSGEHSTTYTVIKVDAGLPANLSIHSDSGWSLMKKIFSGEDLEIGDAGFDDALVLRGQSLLLLAALDIRARQAIFTAVEDGGVVIKDGVIIFNKSGVIRDGDRLVRLVEGMLRIADSFQISDDQVPGRLFNNAVNDPSPGVRRNSADALWNRFGSSSEASELVDVALGSRDAALRIAAARRTDKTQAKATLTSIVTDGAVPAALRAEAANAIADMDLVRESSGAFLKAIDRATGSLLCTLLNILRPTGTQVPLETLRARLGAVGPAARAAIVDHLAQHGPVASSTLVRLLGDNNDRVQISAALALSHCGELAAVEHLLPLTQGIFANSDLKRAARTAVESIQERAGTGPAGGLALSDETDSRGGLSGARESVELDEGHLQVEPAGDYAPAD